MVPMNDNQQSESYFKKIKSQMFSSVSALDNFDNSLSKLTPWSSIKQDNFETYSTSDSARKTSSPFLIEDANQENEKQVDISFLSNRKEQLGNRLSSNYVAHKVIDLVNTNIENNIYTNDSSEALNKSIFNTPMYFGTENSTVVATQIGATAHIPCVVHHIGECVVSWIRKKDYHLLTVGLTTYSSDERFSATHLKHSEDWTLQIKFVQQRDAGIYECQVSTHPPTSIFLHLLVVEARAEISGPHIRYLTPGSTLRLQCNVVQNTEISEYIFWYHDNRMINYDADRGINVSTEPDFQSSELTISRTRREHSGNYTCVASNTQPASVLVHIFKGDNPAAMYHGHVGSSTKSYQTHLLHIVIIIIAVMYNTYVKRRIM
ncbi:defective proboscis extension response 13 isoform 2-T5 [Cochliomyia hominivorax]